MGKRNNFISLIFFHQISELPYLNGEFLEKISIFHMSKGITPGALQRTYKIKLFQVKLIKELKNVKELAATFCPSAFKLSFNIFLVHKMPNFDGFSFISLFHQ